MRRELYAALHSSVLFEFAMSPYKTGYTRLPTSFLYNKSNTTKIYRYKLCNSTLKKDLTRLNNRIFIPTLGGKWFVIMIIMLLQMTKRRTIYKVSIYFPPRASLFTF